MNLQDCIKFATENPVCFVATAEGNQPRVRTFMMWFADENGFYFATLSPKQVSKQLKNNPKAEVCFYNNAADLQEAKHMRVTGEMELVDDEALRKKVAEERAALEQIAGRPLQPLMEVFRISSGKVHFWTMMDILREPELERIEF
jgi:pyridoxamine 5'-phosphate oxidase